MSLIIASALVRAEDAPIEQIVAETHATSLHLREQSLSKTIARDTCWPGGVWGDNLWTLAALSLDQQTENANARLLRRATEYIEQKRQGVASPAFLPESDNDTPWSYFSLTDYVRTLYLFGSGSRHFPGRLKPETEAAMKEALWFWTSTDSRLADAGLDDLFLLLGTENHDLSRRPNHYLVTALLNGDPGYRDRKLADGHTIGEHAAAYTTYFREWPRQRASCGLWVEVGSTTYQKYSWPALFNLHELSPDPVIRHRFGLLLDLAFIEEAQISVQGRRGGGRSRADAGANGFESYKNLLFGDPGRPAGSSHSRVIETSRYQLPPAAILLNRNAFPPEQPYVIRNRVLGELTVEHPPGGDGQLLSPDSALVNYAWRARHCLLGSTLQNPALSMTGPAAGEPTLKYAGISRQKRTCGLLFDHPAAATIAEVHPVVEHPGGGRSQHSFWSVQHENVLILQRIPRHGRSTLGSYNTGKLGMRFEGAHLTKVEQDGWIFTTDGMAFAAVKFLDGPHQWDADRQNAYPANFAGPGDSTRILLHAGDLTTHGSLEKFMAAVLASRLTVTPDKIDYRFGTPAAHLAVTPYDPQAHGEFSLPLVNGEPVELRLPTTWQSPYLNGGFGSDRISITVGPVSQVIDFSSEREN